MPKQSPSRWHRLALTAPLHMLIALLVLSSLACLCSSLPGLSSSEVSGKVHIVRLSRTPLPTLTPTVNAAPLATPATPGGAIAAATPLEKVAPPVAPTGAATPQALPRQPTPIPATSGWSFSGVTNLANDSEGGLVLMGELVNGTGAPQQVIDISGAFYSAQGEVAVDTLYIASYVPIDPVPPDAHVPFELQVSGNQDIDRFDLRAASKPASVAPRQDFQFSGVEQGMDDDNLYCIRGRIENQGPPVQEYLIITAIGYDDQGNVISHGEYYADVLPDSEAQSSTFELCLDSSDRQISRHDLKAFGL